MYRTKRSISTCGCDRRGAVSVKTVAGTAVGLFIVAVGGYYALSGSPEDLLNAEKLGPKEIRIVATKLLMHEDTKIRVRASEKLSAQGAAAVPVLKELGVKNSDLQLRLAVFGVLTGMDADAAAEVVESIFSDSDPQVRQQAVNAAVQLGTPRAVEVMKKALNDPESIVRSTAAGSIGGTGNKGAIPALLTALRDPELSVRKHAARSLKELTGNDYSGQIKR